MVNSNTIILQLQDVPVLKDSEGHHQPSLHSVDKGMLERIVQQLDQQRAKCGGFCGTQLC